MVADKEVMHPLRSSHTQYRRAAGPTAPPQEWMLMDIPIGGGMLDCLDDLLPGLERQPLKRQPPRPDRPGRGSARAGQALQRGVFCLRQGTYTSLDLT